MLILLFNAPERYSNSISFCLIILFIPLLNSSINSLFSYLLPIAVLLNFCTNSLIILLSCSIFFSSATFIVSSSPLPNSYFKSVRNFSIIVNSKFSLSKFTIIFSFHMSTDSLCMYDNTHYTCSSTNILLIFILICNLYFVKKSNTLLTVLSYICSLATFTFDPVLD